jgi:threonine synthase
MRLYNLNIKNEIVNFKEAMLQGIGSASGLYFPEQLPYFEAIDSLLAQDFISRSIIIAKALLEDEFSEEVITRTVKDAFTFPVPLKPVTEQISALELFHGPTLAFKDFGARFMAQLLLELNKEKGVSHTTTILTATSGDTGAAVAQAFYKIPNVQVVILYPHQQVSELQEKLFCTLGDNIHTLAVKGDFDTCQTLVKECFSNKGLVSVLRLNSANSINICRLLAQCFYYFEAVAQLALYHNLVAVPCGNFGNLTAGLFAQQMGLPIKSFIVTTNANDTVPRYLQTGKWQVNATKTTLSNAMDVSAPNNWPRIEELYKNLKKSACNELRSIALSEEKTINAMHELYNLGYVADPHSAIAYAGLKAHLRKNEQGIFLCTAHPAKFKKNVEEIIGKKITLPLVLKNVVNKPILSKIVPADKNIIQSYLGALVPC